MSSNLSTSKNFNIGEMREEFLKENYSSYNVHDNLKNLEVDQLKQITKEGEFPFWVMTLNILGDLNCSTVIRSSHLFGAQRVVVFGRRRIDTRGMVGAANYTRVDRINGTDANLEINPQEFKQYCLENKACPIFIEQHGTNVFKFDWQEKITKINLGGFTPMLVLGTEREGISQGILDLCSELNGAVVSIPQRGVIRSFNLSMAFSVVCSQMIEKMEWY